MYTQEEDEKKDSNTLVRGIDKDSKLTLDKFDPEQHFTQPPAHYGGVSC